MARERHFGADVLVTRKGAIRASLGIVPGSMGARCTSCTARAALSFSSCAYGAGRQMSRTKAKQALTEQDLTRQTAGVECRKEPGMIDEIPAAYKEIDQVMANQDDLVEIVHTLKQVVCVKG